MTDRRPDQWDILIWSVHTIRSCPLMFPMLSRTKRGLSLSPLACPTSWPLARNMPSCAACGHWPVTGSRRMTALAGIWITAVGRVRKTGLEWAIIQFRDLDRREIDP